MKKNSWPKFKSKLYIKAQTFFLSWVQYKLHNSIKIILSSLLCTWVEVSFYSWRSLLGWCNYEGIHDESIFALSMEAHGVYCVKGHLEKNGVIWVWEMILKRQFAEGKCKELCGRVRVHPYIQWCHETIHDWLRRGEVCEEESDEGQDVLITEALANSYLKGRRCGLNRLRLIILQIKYCSYRSQWESLIRWDQTVTCVTCSWTRI